MPKAKTKRATRAPKGLGSITKRGERYLVRVPVGKLPSGKTRHASATAKTLEEANQLRAKLILEHASGRAAVQTGVTLAQWVERHMQARRAEVRPNTYTRWEQHLKMVQTHLGNLALAQTNVEALERFYRLLAAPSRERPQGYSKSTVYHVKDLINAALDDALRYGMIESHPGRLVRMPRMAEQEAGREISEAELEAIFKVLKSHPQYRRYYALVYMLAAFGLRRGEALGIRKENFTLDGPRPHVRIRQQVLPERGRVVVGPLKTEGSVRDLPLSPQAVGVIRAQLEALQKEYELGMADEGWLFPNALGGMMHPNNWGEAWRRILELAGVPHARMHDLRGSFETRIVRKFRNPKLAAKLAGQKDIRTAVRHYHRVSEEDLEEALEPLALGD